MAQYLKIIKNGKAELLKFDSEKPLELTLKEGNEYQLVDVRGNPIEVNIIQNGTEIEIYPLNSNKPSLILHNKSTFQPLVSNSSVALSDTPILAVEVVGSGVKLSTLGYIGGGLLAAGGIAAAASGGSKGSNSSTGSSTAVNTAKSTVTSPTEITTSNNGVSTGMSSTTNTITQNGGTNTGADTSSTTDTTTQNGDTNTGADTSGTTDTTTQTGGTNTGADTSSTTDTTTQNGDTNTGADTSGTTDTTAQTDSTNTGADTSSTTDTTTQNGGTNTGADTSGTTDTTTQTGGTNTGADTSSTTDTTTQTGGTNTGADTSSTTDTTTQNGDTNTGADTSGTTDTTAQTDSTNTGADTSSTTDTTTQNGGTNTGADTSSTTDTTTQNGGTNTGADTSDKTDTTTQNEGEGTSSTTETSNQNGGEESSSTTDTSTPNSDTASSQEESSETEQTQPEKNGTTYYVGGTANNAANHHVTLEAALKAAQSGDTIELLEDVKTNPQGYVQDNRGWVSPLVLPAITIVGNGHKLHIPNRPLSLNGDVEFKNVQLSLQALETNLAGAVAAAGGQKTASTQFIYLNGNKLTLDAVNTKVDGHHNDTRPTIVMGTEEKQPNNSKAELIVKNAVAETRIKEIIDKNQFSEAAKSSSITLAPLTDVINSVSIHTGKVTINNSAGRVETFKLDGSENELILNYLDYSFITPSFDGVQNLTILGRGGFSTDHLNISGKLTLSQESKLVIREDPILENGSSLTVANIKSDNASLKLDSALELNGNIEGKLTVINGDVNSVTLTNSNAYKGAIFNGYVLSDKPLIIGTDEVNTLTGTDADEYIYGGLGNDILSGGKGKDIFVFDTDITNNIDTIQDFDIKEDRLELSKAIFEDLTKQNIAEQLGYNAANGELSYQNTVFVKLPANLELSQIQIDIV